MAFEASPKGLEEKAKPAEKKERGVGQISKPKVGLPKVSIQAKEILNPEIQLKPDEIEQFLEVVPPPIPEQAKKIEPPPIPKESREERLKRKYFEYVGKRKQEHDKLNENYDCPLLGERETLMDQSFVAVSDDKILKLEYLAYTQEKKPNEKHTLNQDCALVDPESRILAVFDGAGGAENGEKASRQAAEVFYKNFKGEKMNFFETDDDLESFKKEYEKKLGQTAKEASKKVYIKAPRSGTTMAFTQVVGVKDGKMIAAVASLGDSPVYTMDKNKKVTQINEEHNLLTEFKSQSEKAQENIAMNLAAGNQELSYIRNTVGEDDFLKIMKVITSAESAAQVFGMGLEKKYKGIDRDNVMTIYLAMNNRVTRSLSEQNLDPKKLSIKWVELEEGDTIMAASDAVSDNITVDQLEKALKGNPKNLGKVNSALSKGFRNKKLQEQRLVKEDDLTECALTVILAK